MSGHGEKASRRTEQAIAALLLHSTIGQAAKASGVAEATLRRWMAQPGFRARFAEARAEVFERGLTSVQAAAEDAVAALRRNLACGRPAAEIRAAETILAFGLRASEVFEFEGRLRALEDAGPGAVS